VPGEASALTVPPVGPGFFAPAVAGSWDPPKLLATRRPKAMPRQRLFGRASEPLGRPRLAGLRQSGRSPATFAARYYAIHSESDLLAPSLLRPLLFGFVFISVADVGAYAG